jgi:hypothetical protein
MAAPSQDDFLEYLRLRVAVYDDRSEEHGFHRNKKHIRVWKKQQWLGRGAYGKVWLEQSLSGRQRAVKSVEKCVQMDHEKEIRAMANFSKVLSPWSALKIVYAVRFQTSIVAPEH